MIKVVITGASGFLGRNLLNELSNDGSFLVYALSSNSEALKKNYTARNIISCDKNDIFTEKAGDLLKDAVVLNCAFPRNVSGEGMAEGLSYIQGVFTAACDCSAKAIVNISSQSVYSEKRESAATEETPVSLETMYAIGKYSSELLLQSICREKPVHYTNIRMASLIGPGFDQRIVNRFVKQALETWKLRVNDNNQRFGFFDVRDAVTGLTAILKSNPEEWQKVYNLGNEHTYSLLEMAEAVSNVLKKNENLDVEIEVEADDKFSNSALDAGRFYSAFNFRPCVTLKESIEKILEREKNEP